MLLLLCPAAMPFLLEGGHSALRCVSHTFCAVLWPPQDVDRDSMLAQEDPSLGEVLVRVWTEDYTGRW